jgi:hypothetical protein
MAGGLRVLTRGRGDTMGAVLYYPARSRGAAIVEISRRQLVRSSAACLLLGSGPVWARKDAGAPGALADAHVHLFNMADLPAAGFFRYVVLPNQFSEYQFAWPALIDLAEFLKSLTITAAQEGRDPTVPGVGLLPADYSRKRFSLLVAQRITAMAQGRAPAMVSDGGAGAAVTDETDLAGSYAELARRLSSRKRGPAAAVDSGLGASAVDPATISALVEQEDAPGFVAPGGLPLAEPCSEAPTKGPETNFFIRMGSLLTWVRWMMQSRENHLKRYVGAISSPRRKPRLIVNLLVDYDRWLGDSPLRGSDHHRQIALWSDLTRRHAQTLDIRTFAGFDPLKDAEQFIVKGRGYEKDSDLWRYVGYFRNPRSSVAGTPVIHGLKLYPPMGFRPSGNVPGDFKGEARALKEVKRLWSKPPLAGHAIHEVLNKSLDRLFAACDQHGIPLLAHAYHSNEAGRCFGARAGPTGWRPVLEKHRKLRLCLGHFASAADFETAMAAREAHRPIPVNAWPLQGTEALLKLNTAECSRVFADIGYMSEFLVGTRSARAVLTKAFFCRLKEYCVEFDPGCRHIMFGSDWIMLGQEPRHDQYVETIEQGLADAGWEPDWRHNFLYGNLERFLAPRP